MSSPTRHFAILFTAVLTVFALAMTIAAESGISSTNSVRPTYTLEMLRKAAAASRSLL